jgi:hypothetical protein
LKEIVPMLFPLFALAAAQTLTVATPAFDPRSHKRELAGAPAQVLVLGSPHLSQLPKKLDPKLLAPLLDRFAAFRPDVIAIENISGEQCETLKRFKSQHGDAWDGYCWDTDEVEKATGLNVDQALGEIDRTLASWPDEPTPAQRRRLAMLFLAANDRPSAQVQWLQLAPAERLAADGLTAAMVEILERKGKPLNESIDVAAALAARLGLERLTLMDDHTADWAFDEKSPEGLAYAKALRSVWDAKPTPAVRTRYEQLQAHLDTPAEVIGFYRFLNDPETQRATIASDMVRAARVASAQPYGREYVSWWETRNLRMTANIHAAFQHKPGAHVLVIVGATHKGYLDAYLDMMQDVRLVDALQFLK